MPPPLRGGARQPSFGLKLSVAVVERESRSCPPIRPTSVAKLRQRSVRTPLRVRQVAALPGEPENRTNRSCWPI